MYWEEVSQMWGMATLDPVAPGERVSSRGEREFPFPSIPKNESLWFPFPNYGNGFFHSLPVPEFRECFFFIPFPFPNYGNGFFSFPSRSRIVGMDFFHSLPVPELWEWIFLIPFPFPNLLFHRRESKRELDYCKRYQASNFFSFLYISQNNYIEEVNWAKMFKSEWLKRQDIMLSFVANSFAAKVLLIVNKIILFWFLFFNSGRYNNKKTGDYQEQRRMGLRMFGPKLFLTPHIC